MKTHSKKRGFTLIELLTVIAIIGILAAIIIPTVGKVRESAKRSKCMSNVRQISLALINAANQDRKQMFPDSTPGDPPLGPTSSQRGGWAWDVRHVEITDLVKSAGREVMYCPSSFMMTNYKIDDLYLFRPDFAVTSYVLLIPGTPQILPEYLSDRVKSSYTVGTGASAKEVPASMRPLVVDAVISDSNALTSFVNVTGGLPNNVSNHMTGTMPTGAHFGYVDAHVRWRSFEAATSSNPNGFGLKSTGANPKFWF